MKNTQHIREIILAMFLSALIATSAAGQDVGEIRNLSSVLHVPDMPSSLSRIEMSWDAPEGDPYGYFTLFDTSPGHTFDLVNTADMSPSDGESAVSPDFADSSPDDVAYYFHIAAQDGWGDIGPTTTAGPFRIDVVPPSPVCAEGPEITSVRTVSLTLEAEGASHVLLSNAGYEAGWERIPLLSPVQWTLSPGGGEKTVQVRLSDLAGNTADTQLTIFYMVGDADADGAVELRDALLILGMLAGNGQEINPDADTDADGKVGIREAAYVLGKTSE